MELTHGALGFRTGTPAVRFLKGWTETMVLAVLDIQAEWRKRYIRQIVEVNKQAIIEDRDGLGADKLNAFGVKITQSETFFVEPKIEPKG
jgi:phage host-nuclease inhibitor protein Gam